MRGITTMRRGSLVAAHRDRIGRGAHRLRHELRRRRPRRRRPTKSATWSRRSRSSRGPATSRTASNDPAVDWVTPFEEETGCEVVSKSYGTSDEAVNLMKTGDYDVVAASGDATLRLIAAGDVAPVNTDLIPNYEGIYDFLKDQAWNSVDGESYGVPHGYGANLLLYNTDVVTPAPTSWDVVFDKASDYTGKVTAYDSPIYIADAAVYLMAHQPDLGIDEPVRPRRDAVPGGRRPAQGAAPAHQRVLVGLPQGDQRVRDRRLGRRHDVAGHRERRSRARARRPTSCCPKRVRPAGRTPG